MLIKYPYFNYGNPKSIDKYGRAYRCQIGDLEVTVLYTNNNQTWNGYVSTSAGAIVGKDIRFVGDDTEENFNRAVAAVVDSYSTYITQHFGSDEKYICSSLNEYLSRKTIYTGKDTDKQELEELKRERRKQIGIKVGNYIILCLSLSALIIYLILLLKK